MGGALPMHPVELGAYATVVAVALAHLTWSGYQYSEQFERGGMWDGHAPGLQPGWLFGRRMDLSDAQWREFRSALLPLAALFALFAALSRAVRRLASPPHAAAVRAGTYVAFAIAFLLYLHGACAAYVLGLVAANYAVAQAAAGRDHGTAAIWAFNLGALLAARLWDGFPFAALLGPRWAWLDSYRGVVRWHICFNLTTLRMLSYALDLHWARRATQQAQRAAAAAPGKVPPHGSAAPAALGAAALPAAAADPCSAKERQSRELPSVAADYSLLFCLAHALYPPLYLAGPILTFQDFAWQLRQGAGGVTGSSACIRRRSRSGVVGGSGSEASGAGASVPSGGKEGSGEVAVGSWKKRSSPLGEATATGASSSGGGQGGLSATSVRAVLRYGGRLAADLACLELVTHLLYFNSLAVHRIGLRYRQYGLRYGAEEVGLTGWWVLAFMWLKFAVIWRFFRLAALADGVEAPENMVRCFANNYEVEGFWRGWHSSYNRWLVRYLYVPLGGAKYRALAIWPIFLFVAVWHDLEWRLLSWAWLVCLAFLPEMAAKRFVAGRRFDGVRRGGAFRAVAAAAAALNIGALMAANMVGFVVGGGGMAELFGELAASPRYVAAALTCFFAAAQLMFALRAREAAAAAKGGA